MSKINLKSLFIILFCSLGIVALSYGQNKSFKSQFGWCSFAAGQSNHLIEPISFSYDKVRRVAIVASGKSIQNYEVLFSEFSFGTLKIKTDAGVFIARFNEKGACNQISWFSVGLHFKMCYSSEKIVFDETPDFSSH